MSRTGRPGEVQIKVMKLGRALVTRSGHWAPERYAEPVGEIVDNSISAGNPMASTVKTPIKFTIDVLCDSKDEKSSYILLRDNAGGIKDIEQAVAAMPNERCMPVFDAWAVARLGVSYSKHEWGIGLKASGFWMANRIHIVTRAVGSQYVDEAVLHETELDRWDYKTLYRSPGAREESLLPASVRNHPVFVRCFEEEAKGWTGTLIVLTELRDERKTFLRVEQLEAMCRDLKHNYFHYLTAPQVFPEEEAFLAILTQTYHQIAPPNAPQLAGFIPPPDRRFRKLEIVVSRYGDTSPHPQHRWNVAEQSDDLHTLMVNGTPNPPGAFTAWLALPGAQLASVQVYYWKKTRPAAGSEEKAYPGRRVQVRRMGRLIGGLHPKMKDLKGVLKWMVPCERGLERLLKRVIVVFNMPADFRLNSNKNTPEVTVAQFLREAIVCSTLVEAAKVAYQGAPPPAISAVALAFTAQLKAWHTHDAEAHYSVRLQLPKAEPGYHYWAKCEYKGWMLTEGTIVTCEASSDDERQAPNSMVHLRVLYHRTLMTEHDVDGDLPASEWQCGETVVETLAPYHLVPGHLCGSPGMRYALETVHFSLSSQEAFKQWLEERKNDWPKSIELRGSDAKILGQYQVGARIGDVRMGLSVTAGRGDFLAQGKVLPLGARPMIHYRPSWRLQVKLLSGEWHTVDGKDLAFKGAKTAGLDIPSLTTAGVCRLLIEARPEQTKDAYWNAISKALQVEYQFQVLAGNQRIIQPMIERITLNAPHAPELRVHVFDEHRNVIEPIPGSTWHPTFAVYARTKLATIEWKARIEVKESKVRDGEAYLYWALVPVTPEAKVNHQQGWLGLLTNEGLLSDSCTVLEAAASPDTVNPPTFTPWPNPTLQLRAGPVYSMDIRAPTAAATNHCKTEGLTIVFMDRLGLPAVVPQGGRVELTARVKAVPAERQEPISFPTTGALQMEHEEDKHIAPRSVYTLSPHLLRLDSQCFSPTRDTVTVGVQVALKNADGTAILAPEAFDWQVKANRSFPVGLEVESDGRYMSEKEPFRLRVGEARGKLIVYLKDEVGGRIANTTGTWSYKFQGERGFTKAEGVQAFEIPLPASPAPRVRWVHIKFKGSTAHTPEVETHAEFEYVSGPPHQLSVDIPRPPRCGVPFSVLLEWKDKEGNPALPPRLPNTAPLRVVFGARSMAEAVAGASDGGGVDAFPLIGAAAGSDDGKRLPVRVYAAPGLSLQGDIALQAAPGSVGRFELKDLRASAPHEAYRVFVLGHETGHAPSAAQDQAAADGKEAKQHQPVAMDEGEDKEKEEGDDDDDDEEGEEVASYIEAREAVFELRDPSDFQICLDEMMTSLDVPAKGDMPSFCVWLKCGQGHPIVASGRYHCSLENSCAQRPGHDRTVANFYEGRAEFKDLVWCTAEPQADCAREDLVINLYSTRKLPIKVLRLDNFVHVYKTRGLVVGLETKASADAIAAGQAGPALQVEASPRYTNASSSPFPPPELPNLATSISLKVSYHGPSGWVAVPGEPFQRIESTTSSSFSSSASSSSSSSSEEPSEVLRWQATDAFAEFSKTHPGKYKVVIGYTEQRPAFYFLSEEDRTQFATLTLTVLPGAPSTLIPAQLRLPAARQPINWTRGMAPPVLSATNAAGSEMIASIQFGVTDSYGNRVEQAEGIDWSKLSVSLTPSDSRARPFELACRRTANLGSAPEVTLFVVNSDTNRDATEGDYTLTFSLPQMEGYKLPVVFANRARVVELRAEVHRLEDELRVAKETKREAERDVRASEEIAEKGIAQVCSMLQATGRFDPSKLQREEMKDTRAPALRTLLDDVEREIRTVGREMKEADIPQWVRDLEQPFAGKAGYRGLLWRYFALKPQFAQYRPQVTWFMESFLQVHVHDGNGCAAQKELQKAQRNAAAALKGGRRVYFPRDLSLAKLGRPYALRPLPMHGAESKCACCSSGPVMRLRELLCFDLSNSFANSPLPAGCMERLVSFCVRGAIVTSTQQQADAYAEYYAQEKQETCPTVYSLDGFRRQAISGGEADAMVGKENRPQQIAVLRPGLSTLHTTLQSAKQGIDKYCNRLQELSARRTLQAKETKKVEGLSRQLEVKKKELDAYLASLPASPARSPSSRGSRASASSARSGRKRGREGEEEDASTASSSSSSSGSTHKGEEREEGETGAPGDASGEEGSTEARGSRSSSGRGTPSRPSKRRRN